MSVTRKPIHLIAVINFAWALACFFWPIGIWQVGVLGILDAAFIFLYLQTRKNVIGMIFLLVHAYYSLAFIAEFLAGNQIVGDLAFLGTLISFGMQPERDLVLYFALVALFKYGVVYGLGAKAQGQIYFTRIAVPWNVLLVTCAVMWVLAFSTGAAIAVLALRGAIIALFCAVYLACWKRFAYSFSSGMTLLVIAFPTLLMVTRSRLEIASLFLLFVAVMLSSRKRVPWLHLGLIAMTSVLMTNIYGTLRDPDRQPTESYFQRTVVTEGESGNIILLGAFVIGQDQRAQLPASLKIPTLERLKVLIPGISDKHIMADQFMAEYLPALAEDAGFAYSLIADLYVWGGVIFIIISGLMLGKVFAAFRSDVISLAFFFMVVLQLYRQELLISALTLLAFWLVRGVSIVLVTATSKESTCHERGSSNGGSVHG